MILVEPTIIKKNNSIYPILDNLCLLSKNLYNSTLYAIRQQYFENKTYINGYSLINQFTKNNQQDYRALPPKVVQQTIMLVDQNFKAFFKSIKAKITTAKIPHYLDKDGRQMVMYNKQAVGTRYLKKEHCFTLSKVMDTNGNLIKFKTKVDNIQFVRLIHKGTHIVIEVGYEKEPQQLVTQNNNIASIDLGLNNLATITSNIDKPFIISGKPLKYINHNYNKQIAKYKSMIDKNNTSNKYTKRMNYIKNKRNNRIKDYLHKASRMLVNYLVSNNISTLVIGKNDGWKQNINIGKVNNQNFVQVPFNNFIFMLKYKCELVGIKVVTINESYTSKCSFIDNEDICKHDTYMGRRKTRDLFVTQNNLCINADVNGSYNIMRKVFSNIQINKNTICINPIRYTINANNINKIA